MNTSKSLAESYQQIHRSKVIANTMELLQFKRLKAHNMRTKINRMIQENHHGL